MENTEFIARVYELVSQIPRGRVASYGLLAFMAGRPNGARLVGRAMSHAPEDLALPCHRVVNRSGRLTPGEVFGGPGVQRSLLEREGVTFLPSGCIDMKKHLWKIW